MTFTVGLIGYFLPIQVIYAGKTKLCLPKFEFHSDANITHSPKKSVELFEKIIFPLFGEGLGTEGLPKIANGLR